MYSNTNNYINCEPENANKKILYKPADSITKSIVGNNKKNKKIYNKIYKKLIDNKNDKHYYYTDNNNNEWQITEINGTLNKYYFKCSTAKCLGFGMILRNNIYKEFILSKEHNIEYVNQSYYKNKLCIIK